MKKILITIIIVFSMFFSGNYAWSKYENEKIMHYEFEKRISFLSDQDKIYTKTIFSSDKKIEGLKLCLAISDNKPLHIDSFYREGGNTPFIEDAFIHIIKDKKYLFVILKYKVRHSAIGLEGMLYIVKAYYYDNDHFVEEKKYNISGIDGMEEFKKTEFPFKTKESILEKILFKSR